MDKPINRPHKLLLILMALIAIATVQSLAFAEEIPTTDLEAVLNSGIGSRDYLAPSPPQILEEPALKLDCYACNLLRDPRATDRHEPSQGDSQNVGAGESPLKQPFAGSAEGKTP